MFMRNISMIVRRMRTYSERVLADEGLGFPEQQVLMYLAANGESNQESIARFLDIDKGAVAKTVAKLEKKGFISRKTNPHNKREKVVVPTNEGRRVFAKLEAAYAQMQEFVFEGVSAGELERLDDVLGRVADNLARANEKGE